MPAILNNDSLNNNLISTIKRAVAYSNGTPAQVALYEYLIGRSMVGTSLEGEEITLHDSRAGGAILFLFPPYIQLILSILLYTEELNTYNYFSSSGYYKQLSNNIWQPTQLLNINERVIPTTYGSVIYNLAKDIEISSKDYLKYFNVSLDMFDLFNPDSYLINKLNYLFNSLDYVNDFSKDYIDIVLTNDRYKAAMYIANKFNYKNDSVKTIGDCLEKWIITNSFT
ncbi:hypothetical protein H6G33_09300 [Calothrix sp. FACHB-1219]|uniref:hypothetical protein n=1 Tax=unclassified Calothrix TaxID=2619626 RepID=UPI0016820AE9|nr:MULTISPECIES: hypothetical protein [unclassified Calothrix]MBD2201541.1 hypothetical protein [Calothrix sp. FACHB-168]MBD2217227.1 hypothetical protein [Calothrix sp. FACHB-1219]